MKSIISWLLSILAIMFWIFRVVVTLLETISVDFFAKPINTQTEIVLLFITIICIVLIMKRKLIGGIAYFAIYLWYFGLDIKNQLIELNSINEITTILIPFSISIIAVILSFSIMLDILINKNRSSSVLGKKKRETDWFFKEEKYERKLDERADKNQYKF